MLFILFCTAAACSKEDAPSEFYIEVNNKSELPLNQVIFYNKNEVENFGNIETGQTTQKVLFTNKYVVDSIELTLNGVSKKMYPTDALVNWVALVQGATYTYELYVQGNNEVAFDIKQK